MQKIGDSTSTANGAGEYTRGQPGSGIDATMITPEWLNAVQRELVSVVVGAGLTLDPADDAQVFQAIQAIQDARIQEAVASLVASSPTTLDTLNELAQALGNDPSFATTMTTALSGKANKATTLAGYGITDAHTKTETAAAIKAALAVVTTNVSASKALIAAELGFVLIDASAGALTLQLPAADAALGTRDVVVRRVDNGGNRLVVQAAGTDKLKFHTHLNANGYPFLVLMGAGDWWHLRSDGAGGWWPLGRYDNTPLGRPVPETTTAISPGGWGLYHGLIYNRADWPWVWDHAQASGMLTTEALRVGKEGCWTSGDGVSTFRSPEGRAEFIRMLDESRGIDSSRVAGSSQADDNKNHTHTSSYGATSSGGANAFFTTNVFTATTSILTQASGGAEARPRNIAYPGRIKLI